MMKRVVVLFELWGEGMRGADLKFKGLNFSINVVDVAVRNGWAVKEVKEDEEKDDGEGEGTEHKHMSRKVRC